MDNEVLLSVITGGLMLAIIVPLSFWLYQTKKENDKLDEINAHKKASFKA